MRSFFGLLKLKNQGKYSDKIHLPSYKKETKSGKTLFMTVPIQGRSARVKDGYVVVSIKPALAKEFGLSIKELRFKLPINNFFNLAVKHIVKYALKHNITTIVLGDFSGSKQSIDIGKVNNQNFVAIPYYKFKQKLASKCEEYGITLVHQEESYTSKTSFLDKDDMPLTYDSAISYQGSGRRIKRGLYKSAQGYLLNADVNGAANILVKYFKSNRLHRELNALYATRYGCVNHPMRLRLVS